MTEEEPYDADWIYEDMNIAEMTEIGESVCCVNY